MKRLFILVLLALAFVPVAVFAANPPPTPEAVGPARHGGGNNGGGNNGGGNNGGEDNGGGNNGDDDNGGGNGGGGQIRPLRIVDQTSDIAIVTENLSERIRLSVRVRGGSQPYNYTWYQGAVGDTSTEIGYRSRIRLTLEPGNYTYWVQITDNQNNIIDSDPIQVDITAPDATGPLAIVEQSGDTTLVTTDGTANVPLFVTAIGGSEPYSYTWLQDDGSGTGMVVGNDANIALDLPIGNYYFWAQVADANGEMVESDPIAVTVEPELIRFTTDLQDASGIWNVDQANVPMRVAVTGGTAPYIYSWVLEGATPADDQIVQSSDVTTYTATFTDPAETARSYYVMVSDANGELATSRHAKIDFTVPPIRFVTQPGNATAKWIGNEITFVVNSVATGGAGALTYTWHSGTPNAAGAVVANTRAGTVRMGNVTPGNRTFYVVATDVRGRSVTSKVITVKVPAMPKPTATPRPSATPRPTATRRP